MPTVTQSFANEIALKNGRAFCAYTDLVSYEKVQEELAGILCL